MASLSDDEQIAAIPERKKYKIDVNKLYRFVKANRPEKEAVNRKAEPKGKK